MEKTKRKELAWWDILILTILMFGSAIYTSTVSFLALPTENQGEYTVCFSAEDHLAVIVSELVILILVFLYLKLRCFDFSQWKIRITSKAIVGAVALFLAVALGMDLFMAATAFLSGGPGIINYGMGLGEYLLTVDIFTVLAAVINGFFEELYFLGICLLVSDRLKKWAFLFSLLIRIGFHTYQGIFSALGIGLILGTVYFIIYEKSTEKNLFPFFFSHMIADIVGLGILGFL